MWFYTHFRHQLCAKLHIFCTWTKYSPFFFLILVCLFCCLAFIWRTNRVLTHVVNRVSLYIFWLSLKQIRMWTCIDQQQCQFLIILFPYPASSFSQDFCQNGEMYKPGMPYLKLNVEMFKKFIYHAL